MVSGWAVCGAGWGSPPAIAGGTSVRVGAHTSPLAAAQSVGGPLSLGRSAGRTARPPSAATSGTGHESTPIGPANPSPDGPGRGWERAGGLRTGQGQGGRGQEAGGAGSGWGRGGTGFGPGGVGPGGGAGRRGRTSRGEAGCAENRAGTRWGARRAVRGRDGVCAEARTGRNGGGTGPKGRPLRGWIRAVVAGVGPVARDGPRGQPVRYGPGPGRAQGLCGRLRVGQDARGAGTGEPLYGRAEVRKENT